MIPSDSKTVGPSPGRYHAVACGAGAIATIAGIAVLGGWIFGIPRLTDFTFDGITMKANTAVALGLAGGALLLLLPEKRSRRRDAAGSFLAALVTLIGAATLSQHVAGWDLGIDQLFATEPPGSPATVSPGRMGPPASTCYSLIGVALILLGRRAGRLAAASQALTLAVAAITLPNLIGNLYGARQLFALGPYTGISRQTAILLFVLAVGMLCARPSRGLMSVFTSAETGGQVLRRIVGPAIALPILFGRLYIHGLDAGWFDVPFGVSLVAIALIGTLVLILWINGHQLNMMSLRRRKVEQELERLLEKERHTRMEVERSARLKDEFLATLSHELRTPLGAIVGWSALLGDSRRKPDDAMIRKGIEVISRNARIQTTLISDLLDMSRIISGKMRLDVRPVDLRSIITAAVESIRLAADQKSIRIVLNLAPLSGQVLGDPARLQQVVWNIVSNAVKFTPGGGAIHISLADENSHALIRVADTGQGIHPEFLPHAFDRFRQADPSITRRHGGLGLGLAIVKELVEIHGGAVSLSSDGPGKGATFSVQLPFAEASAARAPASDGDGGESGRKTVAGLRVLVLEDEPDTLDVITRFLTGQGADVTGTASIEEAQESLKSSPPDVFVIDIAMGPVSGYDVIRELRLNHVGTPAIALTAYARPEDRDRALDAGFQKHLAKPVDPHHLVTAILDLVHDNGSTNRQSAPGNP